MIKYYNHDIVFQEYPDEVTLAVNLTLCPNRCPGCHSQFLREDIGELLTEDRLAALADTYRGEITCIGFQGGDNDVDRLVQLAQFVRSHLGLKAGWYSGRTLLPPPEVLATAFDYVKLGPYIASRGPLSAPTTNQHFLRVLPDGTTQDITHRFQKKKI